MGRVFANGPGDMGSITSHVIPKTLKMLLDTSLLKPSINPYVSRIKWSNPGKGVAPSPTHQCSSFWKKSLMVTHDYGRQLILKVKSATVVERDPKAPFSIATTPRCRKDSTPFPELLHFTLDSYLIMQSVQQGSIKYHFLSLWYYSTWYWTQVPRPVGEHSNHYANVSGSYQKGSLWVTLDYSRQLYFLYLPYITVYIGE